MDLSSDRLLMNDEWRIVHVFTWFLTKETHVNEVLINKGHRIFSTVSANMFKVAGKNTLPLEADSKHNVTDPCHYSATNDSRGDESLLGCYTVSNGH